MTSISINFPIWKTKIICLPLRLDGLTYVYALRKVCDTHCVVDITYYAVPGKS